ncbi:MAG: protein-methionine-sulfoxide reductase catalytic subunit MsrP [Verrucomicrobia bacterium]|nr:protein-methionine-sulfoxide reductase catalytic subunit MsrP [Verrucomicrobiota bacterium]
MFNIIRRPDWFIPERHVTPESVFLNRRRFLKQMGVTSAGLMSLPLLGCSKEAANPPAAATATPEPKPSGSPVSPGKYPYPRNPEFNPGWPLTNEKIAGTYNNFYEFSTTKDRVRQLVDKFVTAPWPVEISGLVEKPMTLDVQELIVTMPMEERVYRFRCVEAWGMIVPWTGFPLSKLIEKVSPKPEAKFIRWQTFNRPDQAPGWARLIQQGYPLPYTEGLRLDEAMNPLTMLVTGIYGKPLPKQHGAPIRIIVPWKYGYKSIKSIVKIEFVTQQPATLWETLAPDEYPFESNVNPAVPHPRWSQATERMIDSGDRVRTQPYNGYGSYVAKLYAK